MLVAVLSATAILASLGADVADSDAGLDTWVEVPGAGGLAASAAGDVDRDGRGDLVFGSAEELEERGRAFVVFGPAAPATVDVSALGGAGHRIDGARGGDRAGAFVDGAGDVDGDGRGDVVVTAPGADNNARPDSGSAYVVFGRGSSAPVDLRRLRGRGFRIDGAGAGLTSAAGAGDVNGDGRDDVVVVDGGSLAPAKVFVVFGKATATRVDLRALGAGGYRAGALACATCEAVRADGAGDVNGDGRADVAFSAISREETLLVEVAFGRLSATSVDAGGLALTSFDGNGGFLGGFSGVGDFNGDGRADVGVGVSDGHGFARPGAFVGFGAGSGVTLVGTTEPPGPAVFRSDRGFEGAGTVGIAVEGTRGSQGQVDVEAAGDVDRDGLGDLVLANFDPAFFSSRVIVVFGRASTAPVDLDALGPGGVFVADVPDFGRAAAAGDVDGDGHDDVLLLEEFGSARAVRVGRPACTVPGTAGNDTLAGTPEGDVVCGGGGDDALSGLGGGDLLLGGPGRDRLAGGTGADRLVGEAGDDRLRGDGGADALLGDAGSDRLDGGLHPDRLDGGDGADALRGGAAGDELQGGPGGDLLHGDGGADTVRGASGADRLFGADGADRLMGGFGPDALSGGSGDDALDSVDRADLVHFFAFDVQPESDTNACGSGHDALVHDDRDTQPLDCERSSPP